MRAVFRAHVQRHSEKRKSKVIDKFMPWYFWQSPLWTSYFWRSDAYMLLAELWLWRHKSNLLKQVLRRHRYGVCFLMEPVLTNRINPWLLLRIAHIRPNTPYFWTVKTIFFFSCGVYLRSFFSCCWCLTAHQYETVKGNETLHLFTRSGIYYGHSLQMKLCAWQFISIFKSSNNVDDSHSLWRRHDYIGSELSKQTQQGKPW